MKRDLCGGADSWHPLSNSRSVLFDWRRTSCRRAGRPMPRRPKSQPLQRVGGAKGAFGNPFGLGGTVTAGIVSARGRDIGAGSYEDFIQIDAAVNKGDSGGPTFNVSGEVIGVNTAIVSPSGGSVGCCLRYSRGNGQARHAATQGKGTPHANKP